MPVDQTDTGEESENHGEKGTTVLAVLNVAQHPSLGDSQNVAFTSGALAGCRAPWPSDV